MHWPSSDRAWLRKRTARRFDGGIRYPAGLDLAILWYVIAGVLILIGLAGTALPVLPGVPIMYAGIFLAAWAGHFARVGAATLILLAVLAAISIALDFIAGTLAPGAPAPVRARNGVRSSARSPASSSASRA